MKKEKIVETNLRFEDGKPYIETICDGYITKTFSTVNQAEKTANILLNWVASVKKKSLIIVIDNEEAR